MQTTDMSHGACGVQGRVSYYAALWDSKYSLLQKPMATLSVEDHVTCCHKRCNGF